MNAQGVIDLFRFEMHDSATPPLWSDAQLLTYLDDSQKMFARKTGGIPDSVSALTTIAFAINAPSITIDEKLLKIRAARRLSDGVPVEIINYEDMDTLGLRFDGSTGVVSRLIIGMDEVTGYLSPIPTVGDSLRLVVDRLPLADITGVGDAIEIAPQHHMHLLKHMKALAYGNQDAEMFNKTKAVEFDTQFDAYCDLVKHEKDRRKHKTRVVKYGGLAFPPRLNDEYRR